MKRIILLLILPLTALVAIDFTMTKEGLFTNTTVKSPTPTPTLGTAPQEDNPYLEPVDLPECDAGNPEVQFIRSNADWSKINSSSKRIFCVSPGNYRSLGSVKLTSSGTSTKKRYILLNNENNTHPGKLTTNELAVFDLLMDGASYWTIDRYHANKVGGSDTQGGYNVRLENGSSFNIFNRMYMTNFGAMSIFNACHNNTIQNSRFANQSDPGYDGSVAIQLTHWGKTAGEFKNNKIVNNEFYNCNDGFQIVRGPKGDGTKLYQDINAEGTIVDSNLFWKDIPYMENAMDIKAGSDNSSNPVIISNNIIWGYKRHPDYVPGSYGAGESAIMLHLEPHNIKIYNNVFYDTAKAIDTGAANPDYGFIYGLSNSEVYNNILFLCGDKRYSERWPIHASSIRNTDFHDNYILDPNNKVAYLYANNSNSYFRNTKVVNPYNEVIEFQGHSSFSNNATFDNSLLTTTEKTNSNYTDFVFTKDKFTTTPTEVTWEKILDPEGSIVSPQ